MLLLQSRVQQLGTQLSQQSSQLQRVLGMLSTVVENQNEARSGSFQSQGALRQQRSFTEPQIEISEIDSARDSFT